MLEDIDDKNIGGARAYFIRGHSGYLVLFVWAISNITILYVLLGSEISWLYLIFPNIYVFGVVFALVYISFCVFIGYIDIKKKGIYGQEYEVYWQAIPTIQKILSDLNDIKNDINYIKKKMDIK